MVQIYVLLSPQVYIHAFPTLLSVLEFSQVDLNQAHLTPVHMQDSSTKS